MSDATHGHTGELWLIRHGETAWSLTGQHTGRTEIPLTPRGEHQADLLGRRLAGHVFERVWVSPLGRARTTAERVGLGAAAVIEPGLLEWDYGVYEGRKTPDIRKDDPTWSIWTATITGGESLDAIGARVDGVIARARAQKGDVALVAHGHVLRILTARWLGLPPDAGRLFALDTASLSVLGHERDAPVIRRWNEAYDLLSVP